MTKHFLCWLLLLAGGSVAAQNVYREELMKLATVSDLPAFRQERTGQFSSYDRTGGNDDGFSGRYSYLRKEGDEFVVAELVGGGMITRIWTPTPSGDTIRFFFDGETEPRINMPFIDLFTGDRFPFVSPLCGTEIGGYYCYLPIPYSRSLRIQYKGDGLKFHQIQFRSVAPGRQIESFSEALMERNRDVLETIADVWNCSEKPFPKQVQRKSVEFSIMPGDDQTIFEYRAGGRIVGIELNASGALETRDLILSARWDNAPQEAVKIPAVDFFGYAYGKPCMRSLLCGFDSGMNYAYFPMPFDKSAEVKLEYLERKGAMQKTQHISATVYYTDEKRNPDKEGRFYTQWKHGKPEMGIPFLIADIGGRGHYIGTSLIAQGLDGGMTLFWEGDDCSIVDGDTLYHGTGSEDYFNGGWYAVMDRWDRGVSTPLHGALDYDIKTCRTGGYRFFLTDKINFNRDYRLTIEHGPEDNRFPVDYASTAYFYADSPRFENTTITERTVSDEALDKCVVLAQDFTARLYWFSSLALGDGYADLFSEQITHWTTGIDFEQVPMAQFDLTGIPAGRYKLKVFYYPTERGGEFAVWQRTRPVSGWISGRGTGDVKSAEAGEIEINDRLTTITLRRHKEGTCAVRLHSFVLEPIL